MRIEKITNKSHILLIFFLIFTSSLFFTAIQYSSALNQKNSKSSQSFIRTAEKGEQHSPVITNTEQFQLLINEPTIVYNHTHLSITNLTITFANGTEIANADAEDNVTALIYNSIGFSKLYSLNHDNDTYQGWGTSIDVSINFSTYSPRRYFVDLLVTTGAHSYNDTIYSFKKSFDILFQYNDLFVNNASEKLNVHCYISTDSHFYREYILSDSIIYARLFNSTNHNIKNVSLENSGFSGFYYSFAAEFTIPNFNKEEEYYSHVIVEYDEEVYISPPSTRYYYGEVETTTETHYSGKLFIISLSVFCFWKNFRKKKIV